MAADKLNIRLEATPIAKKQHVTRIDDEWSVRGCGDKAYIQNLSIEHVTKSIFCTPLQMQPAFSANASVTRYGITAWNCPTDTEWLQHWDETPLNNARLLKSDGTTHAIETNAVFTTNRGFWFEAFIFGDEGDNFKAISLTFGQWRLDIHSTGYCQLWKLEKYNADTSSWETLEEPKAKGTGYLTGNLRESLCNKRLTLMILPSGDGRIFFRRNATAGWYYTLDSTDVEKDMSTPEIITGGRSFGVQCPDGNSINFQMTVLEWDTDLDYEWITPVREFTKVAGADYTVETEWIQSNLGGAIAGNLYKTYDPATFDGTIAGLTPFDVAADTSYCVGVTIAPNQFNTPMFTGCKVKIFPPDLTPWDDPASVMSVVKSCSFASGENPQDTIATVVCSVPDPDTWHGICNRQADMMIGTTVILRGYIKEPPAYSNLPGRGPEYTFEIQGIAKLLDQQCLPSTIRFDGKSHIDVIRWLNEYAGVLPGELELPDDPSPMTLPNTADSEDGSGSKLQPGIAETPAEWIEKVCECSGYRFDDGPLADGNYGLRYRDPLSPDNTVVHTFYMKDSDRADKNAYDRIHSWKEWSLEPEANELWIYGCNDRGEMICVAYIDEDSANPDLEEEDKPDNWLGVRRIGQIVFSGTVTEGLLKRIAFRIGKRAAAKIYMASWRGDWTPGLWRGSVVDISVDDPRIHKPGHYRITGIDNITFQGEWKEYPLRKADYTGQYGPEDYKPEDRQLLADIRYALKSGMMGTMRKIEPTQVEKTVGAKEASGILGCDGPPVKVHIIGPDWNGL
jgi:hypothetical protein